MSRPERMRRVDEAMKEVVSEAIPTLKDPRIGFVTVTSVETSRDLDHAKVWLSVFGAEKQRERDARRARGRGRACCRRGSTASSSCAGPRTSSSSTIARSSSGVRMTQLIDELAPPDGDDDAAD